MNPYFQDDAVQLFQGDCLEVMKGLESVDTIITDPPYGLHFMGKKWDYEIPSVAVFMEMLGIAKCGATLLCFGGTRTWHRIAVNIEDAGWEIRDTLMWIYGSGFPKSLDIGKAIDKMQGNNREEYQRPVAYPDSNCWGIPNKNISGENPNPSSYKVPTEKNGGNFGGMRLCTKGTSEWEGYGTALKPAFEPIIMAMKPCEGTFAENALKHGVAGLNIDGARVGVVGGETHQGGFGSGIYGDSKGVETDLTPKGRFPANVIHDGSEEVLVGFPETGISRGGNTVTTKNSIYGKFNAPKNNDGTGFGDSGSASRFFYCAKASKAERNAGCEGLSEQMVHRMGHGNNEPDPKTQDFITYSRNNHPTVKPLALMEYLCTLTKTPTGGIVLDPYMGSGTTGMACKKIGRDFIGIEISGEYLEIAKRRIEATQVIKEVPNPQQVMELNI